MTFEIKAILIIVVILVLLGGGYFGYRSAYDSGQTAGKAQIQTAWDNDKAAITATADAAIAAATKAKEDALANDEAISNDLQAQLSAARTLNSALSVQLRNYQARTSTNSGTVPQAGSGQSPAATTTGHSIPDLSQLVADALSECYTNRANQIALIKELEPQL